MAIFVESYGRLNPMTARKKIAIVQSSYIPWRGYFDLINAVDEYVLFDEIQYTKRDWRNRNRIKLPQGAFWLTIPVKVKGRSRQKISETMINNPNWAKEHWKTLRMAYQKAPCFSQYQETFKELYVECNENFLSKINYRFLSKLCDVLGIATPLRQSSEFEIVPGKTERLLAICQQAGATDYLSGPAAHEYLDEALFNRAGISVHWADYSGYPEYRQLHPPFNPSLSIVDLIFNEGSNAPRFLKSMEKS